MNDSKTSKLKLENPLRILLTGNGAYHNRGCEGIVRGTMEILRQEFVNGVQAQLGIVATKEVVAAQLESEIDPEVSAFPLSSLKTRRGTLGWLSEKASAHLNLGIYPHLADLRKNVLSPDLVLEIGGDNYSLDYGRSNYFIAMDRHLQKRGNSVVLWGASIGPFDADPIFSQRMFKHLRTLKAVFVRETDSLDYLYANGLTDNVYLMSDPAFIMTPTAPPTNKISFELPVGAIGINLSKMAAYYRGQRPGDVNMKEWLAFCIKLVKSAATLNRPILLVPHVGVSNLGTEDFDLLLAVWRAVVKDVDVPVTVLTQDLNAAELKWIISHCAVFAGARTHSTIAAISSCVPTLSISYSMKAKGINRDVYGHLHHCIHVTDLSPENFTEHLRILLDDESSIRTYLSSRVKELQARAWDAGKKLRKFV